MVFRKIVKFLCYFIVWIRDFIKKLIYLKSKILTKFHRLLFLFYILAYLAFCLLFHVPKRIQKLWNFLWCFIGRVREFYTRFLENSKSSFKKNIDMWIFFFKFLQLTICFFIFLLVLTFYFQLRLSVLVKKCWKFLCFFYFMH